MEGVLLPSESAMCEVLIVHCYEAKEWATYLQKILKSSLKFPKRSILLYAVDCAIEENGWDLTLFLNSKCIVLLLTAAMLDILNDTSTLGIFQRFLKPPHRVVALLCGISEEDMPTEWFEDWNSWRKLYPEDEPALYISTIQESITENNTDKHEAEGTTETEAEPEFDIPLGKNHEYDTEEPDCVPEDTMIEPEYVQEDTVIEPECVQEDTVIEPECVQEDTVIEPECVQEDTVIEPECVQEDTVIEPECVQEDTVIEPECVQEDTVIEPECVQEDTVIEPECVQEDTMNKPVFVQEDTMNKPVFVQEDTEVMERNITPIQLIGHNNSSCLTVQPDKILCGDHSKTIFIIFTNKLDKQLELEVEFSSENSAPKRVLGDLNNEYTISVEAPDMPPGQVSLTLYSYDSPICLKPVTYYTAMGEISRYLEHAASPISFLCQAFGITINTTEALDKLLTDSLKCRIPASGLHVFGIRQIEEDNMASCQRQEELPTLLHFAAKHGLKKLTTLLLQCPGALQAYSVMNKNGDYPNTLAERNGYPDLRQFMDEFVETADMLTSHIKESISADEDQDVYESMSKSSRDIIMKCSLNPGCQEDIYETMIGLSPECMEDLYEDMEKASAECHNPEEVILRKFFQGMHEEGVTHVGSIDEEAEYPLEYPEELEEDPYMCATFEIYDTVDKTTSYLPEILNRPPAPIPRPMTSSEPEEPKTYISRVFSGREELNPEKDLKESDSFSVRPVDSTIASLDPYAGIKTPGQRQLIALQEKVKKGELSVDDAVKEFKDWQLDQDKRSQSMRYQQENLRRLRNSITRRQKEREKFGKEIGLEITAPLQRGLPWSSNMSMECSVYEPTPQVVGQTPVVTRPIQRGTWQTGSTSSTSSSGSNRLSTHSNISYSSGTEPDFEDVADFNSLPPPPPRPPRNPEAMPLPLPPRIPSRLPERAPESLVQERYISCPSRALPQKPPQRTSCPRPPAIPRRTR
ncbi:hypothetical protein UPYG_G00321240 [Umbra pygmaea]|uniref:DBB domain-containing protein n=1 Tax=Umbra pygmaea TaxID=75934 RepID=A0ABD0WJ15_UMBPY